MGYAAGMPSSSTWRQLPESQAMVPAVGRKDVLFADSFTQYRHEQQRMRLLVPSLPLQSRIDELDRVWDRARQHEERRVAVHALVDHAERRRLNGLQRTKSLVQQPALAQKTEKLLTASCSLPELAKPVGAYTAAAQLMNRRVDVNRLRRCRTDLLKEQKRQLAAVEAEKAESRTKIHEEIDSFEAMTWPLSRDAAGETALDWTGTRPLRKPCAAREPLHLRCKLAETSIDWIDREATFKLADGTRTLKLTSEHFLPAIADV